jgi:hypothetical protein
MITIIKLDRVCPGVLEYGWNARIGKALDFKDRGINDHPKGMSDTQYRYRGMPLNGVRSVLGNRGDYGLKIYGSARNVGNIAAGYVAGRNGLIWEEARLGFDGLKTLQNFPGLWTPARSNNATGTTHWF